MGAVAERACIAVEEQKGDEREVSLPYFGFLLGRQLGDLARAGAVRAASKQCRCRGTQERRRAPSPGAHEALGGRRCRDRVKVTAMRGAEEFKAFEAAGWSRRASTYGRVTGAITACFVNLLLEAARVGAGMRLLDVATGPGYVAAAAAARGAVPVGVDIAEEMLAVARRDHPQLDFRPADAEALPFADCSFDAVVGAFVLNHLPRPEVAAAELARVLASGGRIALSVWDVPERMRFIGLVLDAVARAGEAPPAEPPVGPHPFRFADDAQLGGCWSTSGWRR